MRAGYIEDAAVENSNKTSESLAYLKTDAKVKQKQSTYFSPVKIVVTFMALLVAGVMAVIPFLDREQAVGELASYNVEPGDMVAMQSVVNNNNVNLPGNNVSAAFMNMCKGIGSGMNTSSSGLSGSGAPNKDASNRKWTIQEAYGDGMKFTVYYGEGEGDWFTADVGTDRGMGYGNYGDFADNLFSEQRGFANCFFAPVTAHFLPYIPLEIANVTTGIASWISSLAFSTDFICQNPENPSGACVNLVALIGGANKNDNGGLIGALTSSIYMPLILFPVLIGAFALVNTGLIKRQFRQAFGQLLWMFGAFIVGLGLLLNPVLLSRAPMALMNSITACIVGAVNGKNCLESTSSSASGTSKAQENWGAGRECLSDADGLTADEQMSMIVNGMGCNIYMAFNIQPWSQAMFGRSYNDMDTSNPRTAEAIEAAGLSASDFTVNLRSKKSMNEMAKESAGNATSAEGRKRYTITDDDTISNVAAYQMMLGSRAEGSATAVETLGSTDREINDSNPDVDARWFNMVVFAANDAETWSNWAPAGDTMHRIGIGFLAMISSFMGSVIIIIVSAFALVYYIGSALLMAFAPVFFLIGVHPTRGRRIFLGWFEKVVSNILKYIASALFLLVTIMFYGAVLGNAETIGTSFIFVLILTMALFMYRKEIVDLIGRANMGGEQLSSAMSDKLRQGVDRVGQTAKATAAGAAGGMIAGRMSGEGKAARMEAKRQGKNFFSQFGAGMAANTKHMTRGAMTGGKNELTRDLQYGRGVLGGMARQAERTQNDLQQANKLDSQQASFGSGTAATALADSTAQQQTASQNEADLRQQGRDAIGNVKQLNEQYDQEMAGKKAEYQTLKDKATRDGAIRTAALSDSKSDYIEDATSRGLSEEDANAVAIAGEQHIRHSIDVDDLKRNNELIRSDSQEYYLRLEEAIEAGDNEAIMNIQPTINALENQATQNLQQIQSKEQEMRNLNEQYNQDGEMSAYVGKYNNEYMSKAQDAEHKYTADDENRLERVARDIEAHDAKHAQNVDSQLDEGVYQWRAAIAEKAGAQAYDKSLRKRISENGGSASESEMDEMKAKARQDAERVTEKALQKFDEKQGIDSMKRQPQDVERGIVSGLDSSGAGIAVMPGTRGPGGGSSGSGGGGGNSGGSGSGGGEYYGESDHESYSGNTGSQGQQSTHAAQSSPSTRRNTNKAVGGSGSSSGVPTRRSTSMPSTESSMPVSPQEYAQGADAHERQQDERAAQSSLPPRPSINRDSEENSPTRRSRRIPKSESAMPVSPQEYAQGADAHEKRQDNRFDPNAQQGVPVKRDSRTGKYWAEGVPGLFDTARGAFNAANAPRRRNAIPKTGRDNNEG